MPKNTTLMAGLIGLALTGCAMAQGAMPAGVADTSKGKALVDARGMTLYSFDKDSDGKSACNGPCAQNWPAFKATDAAAPPAGAASRARTGRSSRPTRGSRFTPLPRIPGQPTSGVTAS